jgi:carbamoyltransferase
MFIWHQLLDKPRDSQQGSFLGPQFADEEIRQFLDSSGAEYELIEDEDALCDQVAGMIEKENVVGWFQGRMEFGPRALGGRSILGDARSRKLQSVMNLKIKFRESFRPFAPSIIQERAAEFFEIPFGEDSPYMLLTAAVREDHCLTFSEEDLSRKGLETMMVDRSDIPAVTHVDGSARVQTIDENRHGRYHRLLKAFEKRTGSPVVINTSFNVRGEPIVCSPEDAYRCFLATNMDVLVIERFVLRKANQPDAAEHAIDEHLAKFDLD